MDANKVIRETREKMLDVLNKSGLPIEIIRLLLFEFQTIVTNQISSEAIDSVAEKKESLSNAVDR